MTSAATPAAASELMSRSAVSVSGTFLTLYEGLYLRMSHCVPSAAAGLFRKSMMLLGGYRAIVRIDARFVPLVRQLVVRTTHQRRSGARARLSRPRPND